MAMDKAKMRGDKPGSGMRGFGPMKPPTGRGGATPQKKRTPVTGTPRMGGIKPSSPMFAKGTKCKECGKSKSSCKC